MVWACAMNGTAIRLTFWPFSVVVHSLINVMLRCSTAFGSVRMMARSRECREEHRPGRQTKTRPARNTHKVDFISRTRRVATLLIRESNII